MTPSTTELGFAAVADKQPAGRVPPGCMAPIVLIAIVFVVFAGYCASTLGRNRRQA